MKDAAVYLKHIRDAIQKIEKYTSKGKASFFKDSKTQDAVVRNLGIIGEAIRNFPPGFVKAHPEVPWKNIVAMRNIIIHEYFGVEMTIVWDVVRKSLPKLKKQIMALLEDFNE